MDSFDAGSKSCICGGHGDLKSMRVVGPTVILTYKCSTCGECWEVHYSLHHVVGIGK